MQVFKRPEAEADLEDIWWYIAQNNLPDADLFLDRLQEKLLKLAEFPQMGISREELSPILRSFSVGNYLIFYFPLSNGIDIVRVLHGARNLEAIFKLDS